MEFGVGLFQVRDGEAQVTLGGGQRAVAEQVLHVPEVGMVLDEMGRAGVAPDMRGDAFLNLGGLGMPSDEGTESMRVQRIAPVGNEQAAGASGAQQLGPGVAEVAFQRRDRQGSERHHPVAGPFAEGNPQQTVDQVEIGESEGAEFGPANAGGVKDFEDRFVPFSKRGGCVHRFEDVAGLLWGEHVSGQGLGLAGVFKRRRRIMKDQAFDPEEPEEALEGGQHGVLVENAASCPPAGRAVVEPVLELGNSGVSDVGKVEDLLFAEKLAPEFQVIGVVGDGAGAVIADLEVLKELLDVLLHKAEFWFLG